MVTRLKFILITAMLFTSFANAAPVITLSADDFSPGEPIKIKIKNLPGNPQDWLTLVKVDAPASKYGEWAYTKGVTEGSWTFSAPQRPGDYEVRVFFDYPAGGETIHARAAVKVLTSGSGEGQRAGQLSQQCQAVDFSSAKSLFECMGTIRFTNGGTMFSQMDRNTCASTLRILFNQIDRSRDLQDETRAVPSCKVVAETSQMMTGKAPYWGACSDYPNPDKIAHMRNCMRVFPEAYYGSRGFEGTVATCSGFRSTYETALRAANERDQQRLPSEYTQPACGEVNEVIASLTGTSIPWQGCTNYDASNLQAHLLACVATEPREFLGLRDCTSVRRVYEDRLRATHGGLPNDYSILSCKDAQVVLDRAAAYKKEQEAERARQAEAAQQQREAYAKQQQKKIEAERARIIANRKARKKVVKPACDPGPNRNTDHAYGELLTALQASCAYSLSVKEQLFVAGLGEKLVQDCKLFSPQDSLLVAKFVAASIPVGFGGTQYGNEQIDEMMGDQMASAGAYFTGVTTIRDLNDCQSDMAKNLADGLLRYIKETAAITTWVDGCELYYATRYSRSTCKCMADLIQPVTPNIHAQKFSQRSIVSLAKKNPIQLGLIGGQCRFTEY